MRPDADEGARRRASIDGRAAFVAAAFAIAFSLIVLLERIGAPPGFVSALGPGIALAGLAGIGLGVGSMRISGFFAAGRAMPPAYAAAAMLALATGLFALLIPLAMAAIDIPVFCLSFAAGVGLAALAVGPALRRSGAASLADFLGRRFPGRAARWSIVAAVGAVGLLVAVAGLEGAVRSLAASTGLGRWPALVVLAAVVAAIGLPGGLAGVVWTAAAAGGLVLAAFAAPVAVTTFPKFHLPIPVLGDGQAWAQAAQRMAAWLPGWGADAPLLSGGAILLGVGVLAPLLLPPIACLGGARKAGLATLAGGAVVAVLGLSAMALTTMSLDAALLDRPPDRLPAWSYAASGKDMLAICGRAAGSPAAAKAACAAAAGFGGVLRPQDIEPSPAELLDGLPQAAGLGTALAGAMGAAMTGLQTIIAAAGLFVVAALVGHDGLSARDNARILASPRLAMTRGFHLVLLIGVVAVLRVVSVPPPTLIALAIDISAAAVAPLLLLAAWRRATSTAAVTGLLFGAAVLGLVAIARGGSPEAILDQGAVYASAAVLFAGLATALLAPRPGSDPPVPQKGAKRMQAARPARARAAPDIEATIEPD